MVLSLLVRQFSTEERPPRFYGALCFVGFLVAITWIFLVANEVVGILQAFGMIFGVSDAILGLTIFAMVSSFIFFLSMPCVAVVPEWYKSRGNGLLTSLHLVRVTGQQLG